MKTTNWTAAIVAGAALAFGAPSAWAADKPAASSAAAAQRSFATPEEAVKALVDSVRAQDVNALLAVIGPKSKSWLFSGDKVADAADWQKFLAAYDKKSSIDRDGDAKAILHAGEGDWSFPAPLVRQGDRWVFDADAGREEIINRRIGRNELDTIQTLLAVVDAQREYAANDGGGNGFYASRFVSSPGKKDGLYWPTKAGEPESPLGPLVAEAVREGYGKPKSPGPRPYQGYFFRLLTSQGKDAPGGAYSYLVNGRLFGGFAVVAYPASYGNSGVKTFVVNHDGVVYERDLGPGTAGEATAMKAFNPGKGWAQVR